MEPNKSQRTSAKLVLFGDGSDSSVGTYSITNVSKQFRIACPENSRVHALHSTMPIARQLVGHCCINNIGKGVHIIVLWFSWATTICNIVKMYYLIYVATLLKLT